MIGWAIIAIISYFFNATWALASALITVIFFPKLAKLAFAFIAFPIYTFIFSIWLLLFARLFNFCHLSLESWKTCLWITAIPVGTFLTFTGKSAINELSL